MHSQRRIKMKMCWIHCFLWLIVCTALCLAGDCPWDHQDLYQPVTSPVEPEREVFVFTLDKISEAEYELYDWDKITTLALAGCCDEKLIGYAHSKNTKVVLMEGFGPSNNLLNLTYVEEWVNTINKLVTEFHLDGTHLDFEGYIQVDQPVLRACLTSAFTRLAVALKKTNQTMQVTIDFVSSPSIPNHVYGYADLLKVADFAFLRTYGQRRWVFPNTPCFAWATDANNVTVQGIKEFESLGIPANKLIPGFAWFGFDYECLNLTNNVCSLELYHHRCTVAERATTPTYAQIVEKLVPISTGIQRDNASGSPFVNYQDPATKKWRQVWFNDPECLRSRYALADQYGLRGAGVFIATDLDYHMTPEGKAIRKAMFDALPDWKRSDN